MLLFFFFFLKLLVLKVILNTIFSFMSNYQSVSLNAEKAAMVKVLKGTFMSAFQIKGLKTDSLTRSGFFSLQSHSFLDFCLNKWTDKHYWSLTVDSSVGTGIILSACSKFILLITGEAGNWKGKCHNMYNSLNLRRQHVIQRDDNYFENSRL